MNNKRVKQALEVLFFVFLHAAFMCSSTFQEFMSSTSQSQQHGRKDKSPTRNLTRSDNEIEEEEVIRPYNQIDIQSLRYNMKDIYPMLLVFNGSRFEAYTLGHEQVGRRYTKLVPLLVHALQTNNPERFQPGQPVFQMVFTVSDFLLTECANEFADCPINKFLPPIISFSSVYRDKSILPTAKSFPNPDFSGCMYEWKIQNKAGCTWPSVNKSLGWEDLEDQLVWRGSDHRFFLPSFDEYGKMDVEWLEKVFTREALANMTDNDVVSRLFHHYSDLSPRWKAVALTLKSTIVEPESHHWINVLFTGTSEQELHALFAERGTPVTDKEPMSSVEMSRYRYQIDLAGGGGTTWQGTLTKLRMPGVLFHHETPTKDWFYDLMRPWVHYIPVQTDLGDLRARYQWAKNHPAQVREIAERSTELGDYLLSPEYLNHVYQRLFVVYLGKVVEAYQPSDMSWQDCLAMYHEGGIHLKLVSECGQDSCVSGWGTDQAAVESYQHTTMKDVA
ncbi:Glycosyl transferase family 90 [Fragilaria crotonensis]|nr:Glycosyl transferase family 90 [Fragilaria crotonensis]